MHPIIPIRSFATSVVILTAYKHVIYMVYKHEKFHKHFFEHIDSNMLLHCTLDR